MSETTAEPEVDEDGIPIQRYRSTVLVVVPPRDFAEETLRYARSSLYNVHVGTRVVSTTTDQEVKGRLQDEFLVDGPLEGETMDAYSGVLFAGGEGARELWSDPTARELARAADRDGKLVAAWGEAVGILAEAGVLAGKRFTGSRDLSGRGKYTGREVEVSGHVVTGRDDAVGMRFGQRLAQVVGL